jgi:hypothetical protein
VGFFTWYGLFPQILASWIGNIPAARLVRLLWFLSQIAWWQVAVLFIAILIGCCSNWLQAMPEWRRLLRPRAAAMMAMALFVLGTLLLFLPSSHL